ncbi:hypothetical protein V6N13_140403 [Hibiscus sabdariffa]|uniref:Uncharacterized protein n=1 Tax=Hibiscus sabdariffa TaxID=183260 RepID=A0ABR2QA71_9ROSI
MATPKTPSTVVAAAESLAKSHTFLLLLLTLSFFIFILLLNPTSTNHPMNSPNVTPSIPVKRLLLHASMNFHPKPTRNPRTSSSSRKSSRREFGAEAHEVPSGPNPISNR